jgi:hypothetical protein
MNHNYDHNNLEADMQQAFQFLSVYYQSHQLFSKDDFQRAVQWYESSFDSFFQFVFQPLLYSITPGLFLVAESFRKFAEWEKFKAYVFQEKTLREDYHGFTFDSVIIFEFFMPLQNEGSLRATLDSLFFRDSVLNRLKGSSYEKLNKMMPLLENETKDQYFDRIANWISDHFTGYSLGQYYGRFKDGDLKSYMAVAELMQKAGRYLVDETTAIVKFIFPIKSSIRKLTSLEAEDFKSESESCDQPCVHEDKRTNEIHKEATLIRFFFDLLFVESILQVVNGEHEIWMLESGMRTRLYVWRVE